MEQTTFRGKPSTTVIVQQCWRRLYVRVNQRWAHSPTETQAENNKAY